jgi:hypothetical protein
MLHFLVSCVDDVFPDFDDVAAAVDSLCEKCVGFDGSRHRLALGLPTASVTIGTLGRFSVNRLTCNDQMQLETWSVTLPYFPPPTYVSAARTFTSEAAMFANPAWTVDVTRVLTRRELATVLADATVSASGPATFNAVTTVPGFGGDAYREW